MYFLVPLTITLLLTCVSSHPTVALNKRDAASPILVSVDVSANTGENATGVTTDFFAFALSSSGLGIATDQVLNPPSQITLPGAAAVSIFYDPTYGPLGSVTCTFYEILVSIYPNIFCGGNIIVATATANTGGGGTSGWINLAPLIPGPPLCLNCVFTPSA